MQGPLSTGMSPSFPHGLNIGVTKTVDTGFRPPGSDSYVIGVATSLGDVYDALCAIGTVTGYGQNIPFTSIYWT